MTVTSPTSTAVALPLASITSLLSSEEAKLYAPAEPLESFAVSCAVSRRPSSVRVVDRLTEVGAFFTVTFSVAVLPL